MRRKIDQDRWDATDDNPPEQITFGAYAARWLANRQVAGRPIKARTREHYQRDPGRSPTRHVRRTASSPRSSPRTSATGTQATLVDRPTMRSHAYSLLRTILASAVNDEIIDANPCRIVGAGPRQAGPQDPAGVSVAELGVLTEAMPERLRLMVTLASWCALRFGETVELRRGDIDLSDEVIRIRRAAVRTKGTYTITTPKSDAGIRDVAIPPHIIPPIEQHLAKYVDSKRDSLIFPADNGGHLQPSTLYRHWYKARGKAGRPRPALGTTSGIPARCWPQRPARHSPN